MLMTYIQDASYLGKIYTAAYGISLRYRFERNIMNKSQIVP